MSNKSSPRRRTARRYDEDYEYYVPVRYYKVKSEHSEVPETTDADTKQKKRGRSGATKAKATEEVEFKRGPGRPRRYPGPQEEVPSENKPMEVNILSIQQDSTENGETTKKVNLGEVLELAVQSLSVTMAEEDIEKVDEKCDKSAEKMKTDDEKAKKQRTNVDTTTEDYDSDFEWKLESEEDASHSPPAKKKKTGNASAVSTNYIVPTNTDEFEEYDEDGDGRIQVRTIVVGEGDGARIECLSCHRIMKPNSLKAHLKTHAHERPHACDLCDARFTRRGDLERHIKVVHNKDRPFKCSKCHRAFGDKKNLRWHLSNHDRKLFHHCQVCGFKFGKREYWENHVRYIHPIPGTDLEPIPTEVSDVEKDEISGATGTDTVYKKMDPVTATKMLNGSKGSPSLVYTNRLPYRRPSADPFAGLKTPKIIHPPTYWDQWEEFMKRTMVLRFRPTIQRYGPSGRPLRKNKIPETVVEIRPADKPDSEFDINGVPEDQTLLDEQTGVLVSSKGEVVGYPEELCKSDDVKDADEDEEEDEESNEVAIGVSEILEQSMPAGEVLSTHHLVYGEDGQVRLMVGSGAGGQQELVEGNAYEDEEEEALLRGDLSHAFVESGQIVILQPDGSAVLAPPGGQLVDTGDGQLILLQTLEDGTQAAVAYATAAQESPDDEDVPEEEGVNQEGGVKTEQSSNQDAVQTLIDAVQELIDRRHDPS